MKQDSKKTVEQFIADYGVEALAKLIGKYFASKIDTSLSFVERYALCSENCKVGDFVYPGGLISDQVQKDIQAAGVVGWRNPDRNASIGQRGLIVCLNKARRAWSNKDELTGVTNFANGWVNTQALLNLGKEKGWSFSAAEYCASYAEDGVHAGEGFLAAKEQLKKIFANTDAINSSLAQIGADVLDGWYWSSSEYDYYNAWVVGTNGGTYTYSKNNYNYNFYVRCVVAF